MYISNIKLWNFRKFGSSGEIDITKPNLDLDFNSGLNVIIGENDSGKTAIIDAIKLVLKTHSYDYIKPEEKDFYIEQDEFRIELIIKFSQESEAEEAKHFTEYLTWEGIGNDARPLLKLMYHVKRKESKIMPVDVKAGSDNEGYSLSADAREYLKATYLKPLRDAENELIAKRNSRLSQILLGHHSFRQTNENHVLLLVFQTLKNDLEKYFKGEEINVEQAGQPERTTRKEQDGKQIKDKIDSHIKSFFGARYESFFEAVPNNMKSILEKLTLVLQKEQNPGLGTLNRLFMAAELLHLSNDTWTGMRLGLVEELEAHLHPQAQMQVIEALQKQDKIQLILTTHSPNLASKIKLENLIICNHGKAFPMGPSYTMLEEDNYVFLEKFLDTTKANLFFAKGVILVEGWAEEILIPSIAKCIGINLTEKGVSIVNVGSTAFEHFAKIFLRRNEPMMRVPVAVVTDCDVREYEKNSEGVYTKRENIGTEVNVKMSKIQSKSKKNIKYFVAPRWTLEYSLFHSKCLNNIFTIVVKKIHPQTDRADDFELSFAKMLIKKGLKKTEIAYRVSREIDLIACSKESSELSNKCLQGDDTIHYIIQAIEYASNTLHIR